MSQPAIAAIADALDRAARDATAIPMVTRAHALTIADAYRVQAEICARHVARGATPIGHKIGLTSRAKMEQVGVHEPIRGFLTHEMAVADAWPLRRAAYIHPRAEPEIAFVIGRALRGRPTAAEAGRAIDGVVAALDVLDSRYLDFSFSLPDVIADNASSARFVLGDRVARLDRVDVGNLGIVLEVDGKPEHFASSAACLESPLRALAALVALLDSFGLGLSPGDIVLSGAATAAVPLEPGSRVTARIDGLGSVSVSMVD